MSRHIQIFFTSLKDFDLINSFVKFRLNQKSSSFQKLMKGVLSLRPHHLLQGQNRSVWIRLIKLIEPPDTFNYNQFFKHCFVKIILLIFWFIFVWDKMFYLKIWAVLYIFFIWFGVGIWSYRFCVSGAFL